ncbi:MAG: twin-arginine translocase TatA/TatE family subunit [Bacteroidales bacterium]|nr:twin-arginine translocase TatA/TatE family subunit [Bacteroidales bacterium]
MFIYPLLFQTLGIWEILIIALVILLLVGGKKIPELMKGLGKGVSSFKKGMKEGDQPDDQEQPEK